MRIVNRPESTTFFIDAIAFHFIKDEKEWYNVMKDVDFEKDVFIFQKGVHPDTFQPLLFVCIRRYDKDTIVWMEKYCYTIELAQEVKNKTNE